MLSLLSRDGFRQKLANDVEAWNNFDILLASFESH